MAKMNFKLYGEIGLDPLVFKTNVGDGDFNISVNGVDIGYISGETGKLVLLSIDEEDRDLIPGLSLSNGRLTVAE